MRNALAVLLLLHGFAHLVGFLNPWGLVSHSASGENPNQLLGGRVVLGIAASRVLSVVWLAMGFAFAAVAYGWWSRASWSLAAAIIILLASLVLTLIWWPTARIGAMINAIVLLGLLVAGLRAFRADMRRANDRIASGSTVVMTGIGPIEYADAGEGIPILALHGTAGGWDQAVTAGFEITRYGYRLIAPSRFGYLRTP